MANTVQQGLSPELMGVLIGGAIGLVTTAMGWVYNWVQYRSQRAFSLRQSVYLEAAAALARGGEYLGSVWRTDIDDACLADMLAAGNLAASKIHVVGTPETVAVLNRASECIALSALELLKGRVQLQLAEAKIADAESDVAQATAYAQQLASMIDELPKSAPTPEILAAIPGLVVEFTRARDRVLASQAQLETMRNTRTQHQKQLLFDGIAAAVKYQSELTELNIVARRELGLPLDEAKYRTEGRQTAERMTTALHDTVRALESGES